MQYKKEVVCGIEMCRGCEYDRISPRTDKELFYVGLVLVIICFIVAFVTL